MDNYFWLFVLVCLKGCFFLNIFVKFVGGLGGYNGLKVISICNVMFLQLEIQKEDLDEIFFFWRFKD